MIQPAAEIIAVGEELVHGEALDTNSQWLSCQLADLGVATWFHTTVGDNLERMTAAIHLAVKRAGLVLVTGGLGPTEDDLTREALAMVSGRPLEFDASAMESIRQMFARRRRPMPERNTVQAMFPRGSTRLDNAVGTAPGFCLDLEEGGWATRVYALPGVPAEMKPMFLDYVRSDIAKRIAGAGMIRHYEFHCFGKGESEIEALLPHLIRRDRNPLVGITASQSVITLRVTAHGASVEACDRAAAESIQLIRATLGDLIFGVNGETLEQVVIRQLAQARKTLGVLDFGLAGAVGFRLGQADRHGRVLGPHIAAPASVYFGAGDTAGSQRSGEWWNHAPARGDGLPAWAEWIRNASGTDIGVAIGPIDWPDDDSPAELAVALGSLNSREIHRLDTSGPPAWRESRAHNAVLNQIRLFHP